MLAALLLPPRGVDYRKMTDDTVAGWEEGREAGEAGEREVEGGDGGGGRGGRAAEG